MPFNSLQKSVTITLDISSSVGNTPMNGMYQAFKSTGASVNDGKTQYYQGFTADFFLSVVIEAISGALFEKFILDPMLNKLKGQWEKGAKQLLRDYPNKGLKYRVLVHLQDEGLSIELEPISRDVLANEGPLEADEKAIIDIWRNIAQILSILRANNRIKTTKRIKIIPAGSNPLVLGYENGKPSFICNIQNQSIEIIKTETTEQLAIMWAEHQRKVLKWQINAKKALEQSRNQSNKIPDWAVWYYAHYGQVDG